MNEPDGQRGEPDELVKREGVKESPSNSAIENESSQISGQQILFEAQRIYRELQKLNAHKVVRVYDSASKLIFYQFLKGVAFGLGSVIGATIIVSIAAYFLSHLELVPVVGEWVKLVLEEIER